jgi:hypothetical protein
MKCPCWPHYHLIEPWNFAIISQGTHFLFQTTSWCHNFISVLPDSTYKISQHEPFCKPPPHHALEPKPWTQNLITMEAKQTPNTVLNQRNLWYSAHCNLSNIHLLRSLPLYCLGFSFRVSTSYPCCWIRNWSTTHTILESPARELIILEHPRFHDQQTSQICTQNIDSTTFCLMHDYEFTLKAMQVFSDFHAITPNSHQHKLWWLFSENSLSYTEKRTELVRADI